MPYYQSPSDIAMAVAFDCGKRPQSQLKFNVLNIPFEDLFSPTLSSQGGKGGEATQPRANSYRLAYKKAGPSLSSRRPFQNFTFFLTIKLLSLFALMADSRKRKERPASDATGRGVKRNKVRIENFGICGLGRGCGLGQGLGYFFALFI